MWIFKLIIDYPIFKPFILTSSNMILFFLKKKKNLFSYHYKHFFIHIKPKFWFALFKNYYIGNVKLYII